MSSPYTYEEAIRTHRQAFYDWLGGIHVDYPPDEGGLYTQRANHPILRTFASPDRAFATVAEMLIKTGWFVDQADAEAMRVKSGEWSILPLPFVTIQMGDPAIDPEFSSAPKRPQRSYNTTTGHWERHPWPGHYRTSFAASFWCRKVYTDDHIREWILAQFGNIGAGISETFIPVKHRPPWGTMIQALKMEGSDDQSQLEGSDTRYRRFTFNFSLRTWIMKLTIPEADPVNKIIVNAALRATPVNDAPEDSTPLPNPFIHESDNLFFLALPDKKIPTLWPKTGDALVSRPPAGRGELQMRVVTEDDTVDFGEWLTYLDGGRAIFSVWFDYTATSPITLESSQRAPAADTRHLAFSRPLSKQLNWSPVHEFMLFSEGVAAVTLAGAGTASRVSIRRTHVQRLTLESHTSPITLISTGAVFDSLAGEAYLVCLVLSATGPGDVVTVADDASAPVNSKSRDVDVTAGTGVVFLTQPRFTSLRLTWPSTTTVATVWVQRYYGSYHGNSA